MKQVKQAMNQPEVEASIELMAEGNFHDALARYDTKGGIKWTRT